MSNNSHSRFTRLIAVIAFLSITAAVWSVRLTPLAGFELSVYSAHPQFWIVVAICLSIVVLLALFGSSYEVKLTSLVGILTIGLISGFPIIRGYHFYSLSDGLSHLGYVRDVGTYSIIKRTNLYPGIHLEAGAIKLVSGLSPENALMLLIPIVVVLFALSIGIAASQLTSSRRAFSTGILTSLFIAPNMSAQNPLLEPTSSSIAVFFSAFVISILLVTIKRWSRRYLFILFVSASALVFFHAQYTVAFIFASLILGLTVYCLPSEFPQAIGKHIFLFSIALALFTFLWIIDKTALGGAIAYILKATFNVGSAAPAGIQTRSEGLAAVGASIIEIAAKILTAKIILCFFALITIIKLEAKQIGQNGNWKLSSTTIVAISGAAVFLFVGIYLSIGQLIRAVRYSAFFLVFATIIAAVGLNIIQQSDQRYLKMGLALILITSLVMTVPVYFLSPYLYQHSPNTPESEFAGYNTLFTHQGSPVIATTRGEADRFWVSLYGDHKNRRHGPRRGGVGLANLGTDRGESFLLPFHWNGGTFSSAIESETYIVVSDRTKMIDTKLYDGLRFTDFEFQSLETDTSSSKIIDTGGNTVYLAKPSA